MVTIIYLFIDDDDDDDDDDDQFWIYLNFAQSLSAVLYYRT